MDPRSLLCSDIGDDVERRELLEREGLVQVVHRHRAEGPELGVDLPDDAVDRLQLPAALVPANDCYAPTCHRMIFANLRAGKPLDKCPDRRRW